MPKVLITDQQKRDVEIQGMGNEILRRLRHARVDLDLGEDAFAEHVGISPSTWQRWRFNSADCAGFKALMDALLRCGLTLQVMTESEAKQWRKERTT